MRSTRVERLLRLLRLLQSRPGLDADALARELGVSRRTVFRDLKMLEEAGATWAFDTRTRGYRLVHGAHLPPPTFTLAEALALLVLTRRFLSRSWMPGYEEAARAAAKIESTLPRILQERCGSVLERLAVRLAPMTDAEAVTDVFARLVRAIHEKRQVRLRYDSFYEGRQITTVLSPYVITFLGRAWYVIGRSRMHRAVRMFKLGRIAGLEVLEETFRVPAGFSLERYLGKAWQCIRGERTWHVVIRFLPKVAGNVEEVIWHATQRTTRLPDGSLRFEVDVDGIEEISWWVLGYADQAIVERPKELRDLIVQRARGLLAHYGVAAG